MRHVITAAALALGTITAAGVLTEEASATVYTYGFDGYRGAGDQRAGSYVGLRFTFDGDEGADGASYAPTLSVSGSVRMNEEVGQVSGGWFALTPGGDPRATNDQIAIFYMDFGTGRVSAYRYDGTLGTNGILTYRQDDLFITSYADAVQTTVTDGVLDFSLDLDVAAVQLASDAEGYTGAAFADEIGIWLHLSVLRGITFDADGRVTSFASGPLASFDLPRSPADAVPLPGAVVFALTGLGGIAAARRAKR